MKLNISSIKLNGYVNVDITKVPINLMNLNHICDDAECTDIVLFEVLRSVSYDNLEKALKHVFSKLRHNGVLTITFTDYEDIKRQMILDNITEQQFNNMLFYANGRGCHSYTRILEILETLDIKIIGINPNQTMATTTISLRRL